MMHIDNIEKVSKTQCQFSFLGRYYRLHVDGHLYPVENGVRGKMCKPNKIQGRAVCILSNKGTNKQVPLAKLMLMCFNNDERGRTWVVKHLDGDKMNCCLDNLEWQTMKDSQKGYNDEMSQAKKLYKNESPEAAAQYLLDVLIKEMET